MKFIEHGLSWTDKTQWAWPEGDVKLLKVFDQVNDIDHILKHVPADRRNVCIQAGGACGVWPLRYSMFFDKVYTYEPVADNFDAMVLNIEDINNIECSKSALSDMIHVGKMLLSESESNNAGAYFFVISKTGTVTTTTIDALALDQCDLIQLDIEGGECLALEGGLNTIREFSPVIVIEEKPLAQLAELAHDGHLMARRLLEKEGYKEVDRIHRDVIFRKISLC